MLFTEWDVNNVWKLSMPENGLLNRKLNTEHGLRQEHNVLMDKYINNVCSDISVLVMNLNVCVFL